MAMFRLADNVPDVYVKESRDFQLLCNSFDAVQNSVKYDIDSILSVAVTDKCNDNYLSYLQTKLGFFPKNKYNSEQLRIILQLFPYIVRNKGSINGINSAVQVFLHALGIQTKTSVSIDNDNYAVVIQIQGSFIQVELLTEILNYVVPTGYKLVYQFYESSYNTTVIPQEDSFTMKVPGEFATTIVKESPSGATAKWEKVDLFNLQAVSTTRTIEEGLT